MICVLWAQAASIPYENKEPFTALARRPLEFPQASKFSYRFDKND